MKTINKILCPVDFSTYSRDAFEYAKSLAERFEARLELLHVAPSVNETYVALLPDFPTAGMYKAADLLTDFNHFTGDWSGKFKKTIKTGTPYLEIVDYADTSKADLIVIGARGHSNFERIFLGSTGEKVIRHAKCPVLSVREQRELPIRRILVPVDYSPLCYAVFPMVAAIAKRFKAEVDFLHVVEMERHATALDPEKQNEYFELLRTKLSDQWETPEGFTHIETQKWVRHHAGSAGYGILDFARDRNVDLIVMATHGRSGLSKMLMGSVTEKVMRISHIPLLSLRSGEFSTD